MALPIHVEQLERDFIKSTELLILAFEDLNIDSKIREYIVRLVDDKFREIARKRMEKEKMGLIE